MVDHIMTLIKQNNTTVSAVEKKLGWGNGSISKFDKSSPSIKKGVDNDGEEVVL